MFGKCPNSLCQIKGIDIKTHLSWQIEMADLEQTTSSQSRTSAKTRGKTTKVAATRKAAGEKAPAKSKATKTAAKTTTKKAPAKTTAAKTATKKAATKAAPKTKATKTTAAKTTTKKAPTKAAPKPKTTKAPAKKEEPKEEVLWDLELGKKLCAKGEVVYLRRDDNGEIKKTVRKRSGAPRALRLADKTGESIIYLDKIGLAGERDLLEELLSGWGYVTDKIEELFSDGISLENMEDNKDRITEHLSNLTGKDAEEQRDDVLNKLELFSDQKNVSNIHVAGKDGIRIGDAFEGKRSHFIKRYEDVAASDGFVLNVSSMGPDFRGAHKVKIPKVLDDLFYHPSVAIVSDNLESYEVAVRKVLSTEEADSVMASVEAGEISESVFENAVPSESAADDVTELSEGSEQDTVVEEPPAAKRRARSPKVGRKK